MKFIKSSIFMLIIFFTLNLIITIISYFDLFNNSLINIIKIISFIIIFISTGIYLGLNSKKKAYIEGLKLSAIIIVIFSIITLIIPNLDFSIKTIISYLLLTSLIVIGSSIGINKRRLKN